MKKVQICGSISELNCTSFNHKATTAFSLCQFVVMAQIKLKWKVKNTGCQISKHLTLIGVNYFLYTLLPKNELNPNPGRLKNIIRHFLGVLMLSVDGITFDHLILSRAKMVPQLKLPGTQAKCTKGPF